MSVASWLRWALAVAMVGVVAYHLARIAGARGLPRRAAAAGVELDVEVAHAGMGMVMTAMLIGTIAPVDGRWLATGFAVAAVWFLGRSTRGYVSGGLRAVFGPGAQVIAGAAMVFMLAGTARSTGSGAMTGMSMPAPPTSIAGVPGVWLRAVLVAATVLVAAWGLRRLRARSVGSVGANAPILGAGCQLAMNATTIYMLMAI